MSHWGFGLQCVGLGVTALKSVKKQGEAEGWQGSDAPCGVGVSGSCVEGPFLGCRRPPPLPLVHVRDEPDL